MQKKSQKPQSNIGAVISCFGNFIYWFIHNEIATPILMLCLIIFGLALAPFYKTGNYFYHYYCCVNDTQRKM